MNSPFIFNTAQLAILNTLYSDFIKSGGYVPKANPDNNIQVNNVYTATLQGLSGEVNYNNITIAAGSVVTFTINNSYAVSGKIVYPYIAASNNGNPYPLSALCAGGVITILVSSLIDPEDAITIGFIFLN